MAEFSNSQKLAAVLSDWARPAISQIASNKIAGMPFMKSVQTAMQSFGLVSDEYNIVSDIDPFVQPVINSILTPMMARYIGNLPDEAIPDAANAIVGKMKEQGSVKLLDGLIVLEEGDIEELESLLHKNLPVKETDSYQVIH